MSHPSPRRGPPVPGEDAELRLAGFPRGAGHLQLGDPGGQKPEGSTRPPGTPWGKRSRPRAGEGQVPPHPAAGALPPRRQGRGLRCPSWPGPCVLRQEAERALTVGSCTGIWGGPCVRCPTAFPPRHRPPDLPGSSRAQWPHPNLVTTAPGPRAPSSPRDPTWMLAPAELGVRGHLAPPLSPAVPHFSFVQPRAPTCTF